MFFLHGGICSSFSQRPFPEWKIQLAALFMSDGLVTEEEYFTDRVGSQLEGQDAPRPHADTTRKYSVMAIPRVL